MYDRVTEKLDRQLLDRPEPPSHQTARQQLTKAGIKHSKVIAANPEAILYLDDRGHPMTAWSEVAATGAVKFKEDRGFQAEPTMYAGEW